MCLSTVYKAEGDSLEEVCSFVSSAKDNNGSIEFTDVNINNIKPSGGSRRWVVSLRLCKRF